MLQMKSDLILNEQLTEDCWRMVLEASQIASEIKPGQFIMLKITETIDPLFRRPFSVFRRVMLDQNSLGIEVVYKVVGRGTQYMTHLKQGDGLDIIGPLGHGFEWHRDRKTHILVGGGTGSASLFMLGEEISKAAKEDGLELFIFLGAETEKSLILEREFKKLNGKVVVSTDDGTYGYHGLVTEVLKDAINEGKIPSDCAIYASGPEPMLKALAPICQQYRIPAQISMERHMMCGIGGCFVCVCKVDKNQVLKYRDLKSSHIQFSPEQWGYALVCKDGPVFYIDEVIFDE
jgi:dihydroorotate dehydrogenase electron transfer subunit